MNYIKQLGIEDVLDSLNRDYGNKWKRGNLKETLKGDPRLDTILKLRTLTGGDPENKPSNDEKKKRHKLAVIGLRKLRMDKGLSQREFADQVNHRYKISFTEYMVSNYERGINRLSEKQVEVLADFFGLTVMETKSEIEKVPFIGKGYR